MKTITKLRSALRGGLAERSGRLILALSACCAVGCLAACGGGSGGDPGAATSTQACNVKAPTCTVSASPPGTQDSPVAPGTQITLTASCNASLTQANWFTNGKTFATGNSTTVSPNVSTSYGFAYGNCAGSDHTGLNVYVAASGGGTSASTSSDTTGSGSGSVSVTQTAKSGQAANQCISTQSDPTGGLDYVNLCNVAVEVGFCTLYNDPKTGKTQCTAQTSAISANGYNYSTQGGGLSPGGTIWIPGTESLTNQYSWVMACSSGLPIITGFNTSTLSSSSIGQGYCYVSP
ncbi:MAG TPA: hypothetical protein VF534_06895 [Paraburkholderia sp.]